MIGCCCSQLGFGFMRKALVSLTDLLKCLNSDQAIQQWILNLAHATCAWQHSVWSEFLLYPVVGYFLAFAYSAEVCALRSSVLTMLTSPLPFVSVRVTVHGLYGGEAKRGKLTVAPWPFHYSWLHHHLSCSLQPFVWSRLLYAHSTFQAAVFLKITWDLNIQKIWPCSLSAYHGTQSS